MNEKSNYYENKYSSEGYYWGLHPSSTCFNVLKFKPPERPFKLLELGCGEGRNSIHMLSVFVKKPFIAPAPEKEASSHPWYSGELLGQYHDWKIEYCTEDIDCMSSGVPHKHATNKILSRKIEEII